MSSWLRRKSIDQVTVHETGRQLVRSLSWPHLIALGIGAIVGTGIYTLIGVGADKAGPRCCCRSWRPASSAPARRWRMRRWPR